MKAEMKTAMKITRFIALTAAFAFSGLAAQSQAAEPKADQPPAYKGPGASAIFAGGCFWCIEKDFEKLPGVIEVESVSAYARQFLDQLEKPDVDSVEGLSPAISIEQKTVSRSPRSTVGTVTEIYDFLRLLFSSIGQPHCHKCDAPITRQSVDQIIFGVNELPEGERDTLLKSKRFPVIYTELTAATPFWLAEEYHQDYYKKNPVRYNYYRTSCGRDARVEQLWGEKK